MFCLMRKQVGSGRKLYTKQKIGEPAEGDEEIVEDVQPPSSSSSGPTVNEDSDFDMLTRKFKSLQELYETTQVLLVADPTTYEEAAEKEEWRKTSN